MRVNGPHGFELQSNQTDDFKMYTCHLRARHVALLWHVMDWLVQCQHNVTELDSNSWRWWLGLSQECHTINSHDCNLSQVGLRPDMTFNVARMQNNKQHPSQNVMWFTPELFYGWRLDVGVHVWVVVGGVESGEEGLLFRVAVWLEEACTEEKMKNQPDGCGDRLFVSVWRMWASAD